jgi:adenosylmethionine-8-amino-7-oxononanoate aminotransferase
MAKQESAEDSRAGFGQGTPDWHDRGWPHVWLPYAQMKHTLPPLPVVATDGVRLHLSDGTTLIDGIASWWTACHGYNHPHIRAAIEQQLGTMPHVMFGGLAHEPAFRLAERLSQKLPGALDRVFFSESGSVSVEVGMKMAVQYWINRGAPERRRFVSFLGGYHGDTMGTMAVCDPEEGMHGLFAGLLPEQHVVPLPDNEAGFRGFDQFLTANGGECAAILIEPLVQGAGGMRMHTPETLAKIVELARRHDLLVIFDEIFVGLGRVGSFLASGRAGVVPDIVTLSKALTGGFLPLAATVATNEIFEAFWSDDPDAALMHGPTFMANPLGCAAANASLDLFEQEPRFEQARKIGAQLASELEPCRSLPGVIDVRTEGAIGVVQLESLDDITELKDRFASRGAWIRPFGDIVYLTPSLVIDEPDLATLTGIIREVLADRT